MVKGTYLTQRMRLVAALVERDGSVTTPIVVEAERGSNPRTIAGWLWMRDQRGELTRAVDAAGRRMRGHYTLPGAANAAPSLEKRPAHAREALS